MRRYIVSLVSMLCCVAMLGQNGYGGDYNPSNPPDPQQPTVVKRHKLTLGVEPVEAGYTNNTSVTVEVGKSVYVSTSGMNVNYAFSYWKDRDGNVVSTSYGFYYTMPDSACALTAVYEYKVFDPSNPADPDVPNIVHTYQLTVEAEPAQGGSFNYSTGYPYTLAEGDGVSVYPYTGTGYEFVGWRVNGGDIVAGNNGNRYEFNMPAKAVKLTGVFRYNPASPANPGANYWNASTGELIIDDYQTGRLYDAAYNKVNGNTDEVGMITVSGMMNSNDFGMSNYFSNCTLFDLSRTGGYTVVPNYAFDYLSNLQEIILPSCVETIGYRAFYQCTSLSSVTCYAMTPPAVDSYAFYGISQDAILYVPAAAIPAYQEANGWKDYFPTIMAISSDLRALEVNLPVECSDGRYKNMTLELVNTVTGQKHTYIINDRIKYVFSGLVKNSRFNAYLRNQQGLLLGEIENIKLDEEDKAVTFSKLKTLYTARVQVLSPSGEDITAAVQSIQWIDAKGNYLSRADSIAGQLADTELRCQVTLTEEQGMMYRLPEAVQYTVDASDLVASITLTALESITVNGVVKSLDGTVLAGATLSISQRLNGIYTKSSVIKTDKAGAFSVKVFNEPTTITVAYNDYISKTFDYADFTAQTDLGVYELKSITGATIVTDYTYTTSVASGVEPETQNWYDDYANVAYTLYNVSQDKPITEFNVQYPNIVLLEEVNEGDTIRLTAFSKTGAFKDVEAKAVIDGRNRAQAAVNIVQLGGLKATFKTSDNESVVAMLYDANGIFVKKYEYSRTSLSINGLNDGEYTLVTMANSNFFNAIQNLDQFANVGLVQNKDYVKNVVEVKSGVIASVKNDIIPVLDESKFYYTGSGTSFSVNKTSITSGNYLTLRAAVDFKSLYIKDVTDLKVVVDLPESCSFVDNSVMVGNSMASYILDGNRLTVAVNGNTVSQLRFCVIPTLGGDYAPTAYALFKLAGKDVSQPIGAAAYKVKNLEINVPTTVSTKSVSVTGTAPGKSSVVIYDGDIVIGQATALANGVFAATCDLDNPYNLSLHDIYARVTTANDLELLSETKQVLYDKNAIHVSKVTMYHDNPEMRKTFQVGFDFLRPTTTAQKYTYYIYNKQFTFTVSFTNNDTTIISDVVLKVKTGKGRIKPLAASFDKKKGLWVASGSFGNMYDGDIPVNVSVSYKRNGIAESDRNKFDMLLDNIEAKREDARRVLAEAAELDEEAQSIEDDAATHADEMSKLIASVETTEEGDAMDALVKQILNASTSFNGDVDLSVTIPDEITDEYLANLRKRIEYLTSDESVYDKSDSYELLNARYEEVMNSDNGHLDYKASLESELENSVTVATENGEMKISQITLAEVENVGFDLKAATSITMTDGSAMMVYIDDNNNALVVDSVRNLAWVIENSAEMAKLNAMMKASSRGGDFVATMKQLQEDLHYVIKTITDTFMEFINNAADEVAKMNSLISDLEAEKMLTLGKSAAVGKRIEEIERSLKELNGRPNMFLEETELMRAKLKAERARLWREIDGYDKEIASLSKRTKSLKSKALVAAKALGQLKEAYDMAMSIKKIFTYISGSINDHSKWHKFINQILPCEEDDANARALKQRSEANWSELAWRTGYYPALALTGLATGINGYMMTNKAAKFVAQLLVGIITDWLDNTATAMYDNTRIKSKKYFAQRKAEYKKLKCKKDNDDDDDDDDEEDEDSNNPDADPSIDPSGFVYEAVESNRLEGVKATCYYKEEVENMYGDKEENIVLWNAEEYAQQNPLFTDENGMYRWDVPMGLWQVKFEKDGYETAYSEWLPVPPPQLEVNIGMTQYVQPRVEKAAAYKEAVEITFDKYMDASTLTNERIKVLDASGNSIAGTVALKDGEEVNGMNVVRTVRFEIADTDFSGTTVTLNVSKNVESYAGKKMLEDYSQTFDIVKEVKSVAVDSVVNVVYGESITRKIGVLPVEAGKGKKVSLRSSSPLISSVTEAITLDDNGEAEITVTGELPGSAEIVISVDGTDVTGSSRVNVVQGEIKPYAPKANRVNGAAVYNGTVIKLSCETENVRILYTLDGSCPCDAGAQLYDENRPIIVNEDVTIKAMAVSNTTGEESDVSELEFTIRKSALNVALAGDWNWVSHNAEDGIDAKTAFAGATRVQTQTKELVYDSAFEALVGNLSTVSAAENVKVKSNKAAAFEPGGYAVNPAKYEISLATGWNWIGYPVEQTQSLDEAFALHEPSEGDNIQGQNGFANYSGGEWAGTLTTLEPGHGYMYQSAAPATFCYYDKSVSKAQSLNVKGIASKAHWTAVDYHKYSSQMSIIADIEDVDNADYTVAAFDAEGECRGVGQLVKGRYFISVYGNGLPESIAFLACDNETDIVYVLNDSMNFTADVIGSMAAPHVFRLGEESTGISAVGLDGSRMFDGKAYDLSGRAVKGALTRGAYIVNGKKVIITK